MRPSLVLAGILGLAAPVTAMPLDYMTTTVDPVAQTVQFDLHFVGTPTVGLANDWAQVWLYDTTRTDNQLFLPADQFDKSLIGYNSGQPDANELVVYRFTTDGNGPGMVTELLPFVQQGSEVSFTAHLAALGLWGTGPFGYAHNTFTQGADDQGFYGGCSSDKPCAMPEPGSGWLMLTGGGLLIGWLIWRDGRRS